MGDCGESVGAVDQGKTGCGEGGVNVQGGISGVDGDVGGGACSAKLIPREKRLGIG